MQNNNARKSIDYSQEGNWLFLPDKIDKPVDIFYLYPTVWASSPGESVICDIDDKKMRKGAEVVFAVQASAFFPVGNVFAPYYRQFDGMYQLEKPFEERRQYISGVPKADAEGAFRYFIENYNQGRPFILVSHSQGTAVMKELLFDFMGNNTDIYRRMIAAYLIGYGITGDELKRYHYLKFAQGAGDTGVIISYNTESPGCNTPNPVVTPGSLVINPLSWTTSEAPAPQSLNIGSLLTGRGKLEIKHSFADATVDNERGVLICRTVSPEEYGSPPPLGVFHTLDIGLYYCNLRENAALRINKYFYNIKETYYGLTK